MTDPKFQSKGFSLIEIVVFVAIAGLLIAIIFLGISNAQRSRRDTHRKSDLAEFAAKMVDYSANNNGNTPEDSTQLDNFMARYYTGRYDPLSNNPYIAHFEGRMAANDLGGGPNIGEIYFVQGHACSAVTGGPDPVFMPSPTGAGKIAAALTKQSRRGCSV